MAPLKLLSEREQLELAAKAIGAELQWPGTEGLPPAFKNTLLPWNPKHDDGDSLRLASVLSINIEHVGLSNGPATEVNCWPRGRGDCASSQPYGSDKQAAIRLAIFEAAVLLGMSIVDAEKRQAVKNKTPASDMPSRKTKRSLEDRALDAEVRASQWLADGNAASEAGNQQKADECFAKAQFWLDRANLLSGRGDRPAPKS